VDRVLITAETSSSGPVNLASEVARDRAVVVAVGTVGMDLQRKLYYEKELDFRISRSYGPGRYDTAFEQKGRDYPIGYVRWSETRNMEAFLQLLADHKLNAGALVTHTFAIDRAVDAYDLITGKTQEPYLGVLICYSDSGDSSQPRLHLISRPVTPRTGEVRVGVIGAGNFSLGTLLPAMRSSEATRLVGLSASNGARARSAADKFGFEFCTSDEQEIFSDPSINTVVIATRHHLHARQVIRALEAGKHVFCEKPLCLNDSELEVIRETYRCTNGLNLMVGFNRRFAPMPLQMKAFLADAHSPLVMHYRINAGPLPKDHWINDPEQGGGRILGEVCHFVDLLSFMCGSVPANVTADCVPSAASDPDVLVSLQFSNGSLGTIHYVCSGDRTFSKERVEIFGGGSVAVLDDFRRLDLVRHGKKMSYRSRWRQDKGHHAEWQAFAESVRTSGPSPISWEEIHATTATTLQISQSLRSGQEQIVSETNICAPLVS
jgi:predicted dehydrogenase